MTDFAGPGYDLTSALSSLDDRTAVRILAGVTRPHLRDAETGAGWTPQMARALCAQLGVTPSDTPPSAGELARQALLLLVEEPDKKGPIGAMIRNPAPQAFAVDPVSGTLLIAFAVFALQSHVEFSRDKQGRWEFKFKKTPSKESVVGPLIKKLIAPDFRRASEDELMPAQPPPCMESGHSFSMGITVRIRWQRCPAILSCAS